MSHTRTQDQVEESFFLRSALQEILGASKDRDKATPIIFSIWPDHDDLRHIGTHESDYRCLFQYFVDEISLLKEHSADFAVNSFTGLQDLLATLKTMRDKTKQDLLPLLNRQYLNFSDDSIMRSVELALRLCLTIHVQSRRISLNPIIPTAHAIEWSDTTTLNALINDRFHSIQSRRISSPSKSHFIGPHFTAYFLEKVRGIRIEWTSNLASHLVLNRHRRTVLVYEHKIALVHHLASADPWIPHEIVAEALDSLNLLFPFDGGRTRDFLRSHKKNLYELGQQGRPRKLDLHEYNYWHKALQELVDASEEPASTWRALLLDDRNKVQYWTFWIAIFVLGLTVLGFGITVMGGVYAYRQYDLARLQACALDHIPDTIWRKHCECRWC